MITRCILFSLALGMMLCFSGCGPSPVIVNGVLKMDDQPVEGATVTYITEDGTKSYSGLTDSGGNFSLTGPNKPGALPGDYKVVVVKGKKVDGSDNMSPDSSEYKKQMEKMTKDMPKSSVQTGPAMPGRPGSSKSSLKSDLPSVYASVKTTPLSAKVPPDSQPVQIDIKSKP